MTARSRCGQKAAAARRAASAAGLVTLLASAAACDRSPTVPDGAGRNVLLISIDTLRADRLGCHGYARPTTPALDALAAEGVRFAQAFSQSPWTTPAHMTLMTGLYPTTHGINPSWAELERQYRVLADDVTTLAEVFRAHGYRTLAHVGGATMAGKFGFVQGFDQYRERPGKLAEPVFARLAEWLAEPSTKPFFLFFHTFEVHAPYHDDRFTGEWLDAEQSQAMQAAIRDPSRPGTSDLDRQREFLAEHGLLRKEITSTLYDGGVRSADDFLGRIFAELSRLDLDEETIVAVTSDHGEEFGERDPELVYDEHGHTQFPEMVHVPLILRIPGYDRPGRVVEAPVGLVDIAPTLLELTELPAPAAMQGESLTPLLVGNRAPRRWVLSEATRIRTMEIKALRTVRRSYIASVRLQGGDRSGLPAPIRGERLFDRLADPLETRNLAALRPAVTKEKRRQLERLLAGLPLAGETAAVELDAELEESLRALGYL